MLKIYDNFLSDADYKVVSSALTAHRFPWYFNNNIAGTNEGVDGYQFVHSFFNVSKVYDVDTEYSNFINPIWNKLAPKYMLRAKANLRPRTKEHFRSNFHVDMNLGQTTAIYYLNSNNGSTVFKDSGDKVESVANRLIVFDGSIEHAGTSCTDDSRRVVLNINYIPSELDPLR